MRRCVLNEAILAMPDDYDYTGVHALCVVHRGVDIVAFAGAANAWGAGNMRKIDTRANDNHYCRDRCGRPTREKRHVPVAFIETEMPKDRCTDDIRSSGSHGTPYSLYRLLSRRMAALNVLMMVLAARAIQ